MRSTLFGDNAEVEATDTFTRQNSKILKVALDGEILARRGSMVAYQGQAEFDYEGSGGLGKFLKKQFTGEGMPLMSVSGKADVFLAENAEDIYLLKLENDGITANGKNVLAFEQTLEWDIEQVEGAGSLAGGLYNTTLRGSGWVALLAHGPPMVLDAGETATYVDSQAAVAWSTNLRTRVATQFKVSNLLGRSSGELAQLSFSGEGFVIVQAGEQKMSSQQGQQSGGSSGGGLGGLLGS